MTKALLTVANVNTTTATTAPASAAVGEEPSTPGGTLTGIVGGGAAGGVGVLPTAVTGPLSPTATSANTSISKVYQANKWRLKELRKVPDFPAAQTTDPWRSSGELAGGVSGAVLRSHLRRLQLEGTGAMEDHECVNLLDVSLVSRYASIDAYSNASCEWRYMHVTNRCGLLHGDARTREAALALHRRLSLHDSTRPAVQAMNDFFTMSLYRE
eukprot:3039-Heterococcus_DN1.PRE.2